MKDGSACLQKLVAHHVLLASCALSADLLCRGAVSQTLQCTEAHWQVTRADSQTSCRCACAKVRWETPNRRTRTLARTCTRQSRSIGREQKVNCARQEFRLSRREVARTCAIAHWYTREKSSFVPETSALTARPHAHFYMILMLPSMNNIPLTRCGTNEFRQIRNLSPGMRGLKRECYANAAAVDGGRASSQAAASAGPLGTCTSRPRLSQRSVTE
jgi:hypothetical protein